MFQIAILCTRLMLVRILLAMPFVLHSLAKISDSDSLLSPAPVRHTWEVLEGKDSG
jgi:hypothetical protein